MNLLRLNPHIEIDPKELKRQKKKKNYAKWAQANKEHRKEYNAKWNKNNREKTKETSARWKANNPEKIKKIREKFYKTHREQVKKINLKWRKEHLEQHKKNMVKWYQDNPDKYKIYSNKRRTRVSTAGGSFTPDDIKVMFKRQKGKCFCGIDIKNNYHIDHIIPVSKGGSSNPSNLQLLCPHCNRIKHNKDNIVLMQKIGYLL